ncbi:MAG: efflux RND transporter permease subunit, partial [Planctomycetes bacterium]|nr:efflux RND transporter permease subunit [Planctomycetota bacterium]
MKSLPRLSVENPILINLLMSTILVGGVYSAMTLVREMFPEVTPDRVLISTVYPGATPAEVEKGISIKIEEAIRNIDGIDELNTTIGEGFSTITAVLFHSVEDVDQVVMEIKAAIDALPREDFPADAEETRVTKFEPKIPVINVAFFGNLSDKTLKEAGNELRDELLAIPGITNVVLQGTRRDEISVEVRPDQLNRFSLSFMDVADAIRRANLDLPAGQLKTGTANVSVRTMGE